MTSDRVATQSDFEMNFGAKRYSQIQDRHHESQLVSPIAVKKLKVIEDVIPKEELRITKEELIES
jgi:hypothetical protein